MTSSLRKALKRFDEELGGFTSQLGQEIYELKRNVENRPVTGATYYRHCLEDLNERLTGIGEEVQALEAVSLDSVSLEELVGHCLAQYQENHRQIGRLELQLQKYGYCDLFAPLPPENPLDMLELRALPRQQAQQPNHAAGAAVGLLENEDTGSGKACGAEAEAAMSAEGRWAGEAEGDENGLAGPAAGETALEELTNRLAAGAGGLQLHAPGTAARPKTMLKAMAPMTAVKALMRTDTPSSLSSPEAMSPSMRELLGKYALSGGSSGDVVAPASAARRRSTIGGPAASPAPAYLSPAFQLAAMEQDMQLLHADAAKEIAAEQQRQHATPDSVGGTPPAGAAAASALAAVLGGSAAQRWGTDNRAAYAVGAAAAAEPDETVYAAMTQTAQKLADKPSFLEQYRQKFPHIVASTERLLDTVKKSRPPVEAARVASAHNVLTAAAPAHAASADEDSTLELRAQLISNRRLPHEDVTDDLTQAAAAARSMPSVHPAQLRQPPAAAAAAGATSASAAMLAGQAASGTAPAALPPLRPVQPPEYEVLPSFIRGQLPLEVLNDGLASLHSMLERRVAAGGHAGFLMADVDALGLGPKSKTFINSLVKQGRAQLRVAYGQPGVTTYFLM